MRIILTLQFDDGEIQSAVELDDDLLDRDVDIQENIYKDATSQMITSLMKDLGTEDNLLDMIDIQQEDLCSECQEPQIHTKNGLVCANGHGF
jgi:hypothetical protein